jgi:hypothetical protein
MADSMEEGIAISKSRKQRIVSFNQSMNNQLLPKAVPEHGWISIAAPDI